VALAVALFLVYDWYASGTAGKEIPMLRAADSPVKVKPESPGGLEVPYQDQLVLNQEGSGTEDEPVVEHLLPPPEAPQPPAVEPEAMEPAETPAQPEPEVTDTISPQLPTFEAPAPDSRDLIEAPAPRVETMGEAPAEPKTVVAGLQAPAKGSYVVQLGSFTSRAATERAWQQYQKAHPQLLSNMALFIQEAVVNGRTYYRVQSGSFPNRATAMDLCAQLKAERQDCLVVKR
jgi:septal ring-binding cell division protein DamX